MISKETYRRYKEITKKYRDIFKNKTENDTKKLRFIYDVDHFITRSVERGCSEEEFDKLIKAFIGMLYVRKNFYLSTNTGITEYKYKYFNYTIHFIIKPSTRDSIMTGPSKDMMIVLQTIVKNK